MPPSRVRASSLTNSFLYTPPTGSIKVTSRAPSSTPKLATSTPSSLSLVEVSAPVKAASPPKMRSAATSAWLKQGPTSPYAMPPIDFAAWAQSFGMSSMVVREPGEISFEAIEKLMAKGGPALIDARIDASVRIRGGGRVEALQHMSMLSQSKERS